MRRPLLLALTLLPACATTDADAEWAAIQRGRLERMHAPRTADATALRVRQQDPRGGVRPKLDQREPQRVDQGPRAFRSSLQPLRADVQVGAGNVAARVDGTQLDDRADAWFTRASVDVATGSGIVAELWSSDGDLFAGRRINDGVEPKAADARLGGVSLFPHLHLEPVSGVFRMPVRLGAFVDWQRLDHDPARVERDFLSIGPRVLLEPTLRLLDGDVQFELFTRLGGDVGAAWFEESFRGGEARDATVRFGGELTGGLRLGVGALRGELGYSVQHAHYGDVDGDLLGADRGVDLQRQQVFVGFGFTY